MLKLYNTLTRQLEEFKPIDPPNVGMYSCGPTVYDYAHVGHYRSYAFVDTLKRILLYNSFKVKHVMNLTDVGHLTEYDVEEQMKKTGKKGTAWEITDFYIHSFFEDMDKLNVLKPDIVAKASDHIKEQIELIQKLEQKDYPYIINDGVYFDVSKFPEYGTLARLKLDGQEAGARVDVNSQKKNPYDFALWKFTKPEDKKSMEWDSPWAPPGVRGKVKGVPGWHIECSAMSMKYLGETFDIHTGGEDLIPIHHVNEMAQSEAATGKKFVNYWVHNAHLIVEGEKMSRSKGNVFRLEDIEKKGFEPLALRYLFLTAHYRAKMNFTWKGLEAVQTAFGKLKNLVDQWKTGEGRKTISSQDDEKISNFNEKFQQKINDDLNLPEALAVVWEVAKSNIPDPDKLDLILDFDQVLGLGLGKGTEGTKETKVPKEIEALAKKREELRKEQKWAEADKIRKEIEGAGFVLKDTPEGVKIKKS